MPKQKKNKQKSIAGYRKVRTHGAMTEHELVSSGLRVLHLELPGCNTVTTNIVYLVGSRHETAGKTGLAHMLEHMMFKATHDGKGRKQKELGHEVLSQKGAIMNATTWIDRTNYYFHLPSSYLDLMLRTEAERMRNILIEEKEFNPERKNVLSEYEMGDSEPLEALDKLMSGQAFYAHGYGHSTIGFKHDVETHHYTDLLNFYNTYYWPNNAVLVVVGDVSLEDTLTAVQKHFGRIPASPTPIPRVDIVEPPQEGERRVTIARPSPLNILGIGHRVPGFTSYDWAVGEVLLNYLTDGPASVLHETLIDTHKVSSITPFLVPSHDPYLLILYAHIAKSTTHAEVEGIITRTFEKLAKTNVPARALERAKTKIVTSQTYRRDEALTIASDLTECIAAGDWTRYYTALEDIKKVSQEDIKKFVQTYLIPQNRIVGTFTGTTS